MGANTVRPPERWPGVADQPELATVASQCREHRLICVFTAWDTTGWGDRHGAIHQSEAVDYWIGVREALDGLEQYVIINVANQKQDD